MGGEMQPKRQGSGDGDQMTSDTSTVDSAAHVRSATGRYRIWKVLPERCGTGDAPCSSTHDSLRRFKPAAIQRVQDPA